MIIIDDIIDFTGEKWLITFDQDIFTMKMIWISLLLPLGKLNTTHVFFVWILAQSQILL